MNWIVITLGVVLVMVLSAAMVGPYFVDWTTYRATIEANAERVLGTTVTIGGEADVRLLPSPRIRVTDVRLGPPQAPLLEAASVELDVDLAPLVRGEFKVRDLRLDAPTLYVRVDQNSGLILPQFGGDGPFLRFFDAEHMEVDSIAVTDGRLLVDDARDGKRHQLSDVALTGNARTLRGPFQATGSFRAGGRVTSARIAGGALDQDGEMALSVRLAPEGETLTIGFEGALSASIAAPSLSGRLTVAAPEHPTPWLAEGDLALAAEGAAVTGLILSYGETERALTLSGNALYAFTDADPLSVRLEAEQLDLDRVDRGLATEEAAAARPPSQTMEALRTHFAPANAALDRLVGWGVPTTFQVDVGTLVVGGALVNDVTLAANTDASGLTLEHGEALLPGDAAVDLRGRLARGGFDGRLTLSAPQPALLARWWTGGTTPVVVMNPVHLRADIAVLPGVVSMPDLSLRMGETTLAGHARIAVPEAGAVTSADLSLSAPFVDIADLQAAMAFASNLGVNAAAGVAVSLDIAVDRLRAGPVEGETVTLNADYRDDRLTVDALIVEDFGGTEVFASGDIAALSGDPVGSIEGTVSVRSGAALANVIETLFPQGPRTDAAVEIARHLAPGMVNVAVAGEPAGEDEPGRSRLSLTANGVLAGTQIAVSANGIPASAGWSQRPVSLTLSARNDGAAALLRQMGVGGPVSPDALSGEGAVRVAVDGTPSEGLILTAAADVAGATFAVEGTARYAGGWSFDGSVDLTATDIAPVAAALGQAGTPRTDVRLGGTVSAAPDRLSLAELTGEIGGAPVSGSLALVGDTVTGLVEADTISLAGLASLVLSTDPSPADQGVGWPTTPFLAPLSLPVVLDLSVQTGRLDVGSHVLRDAAFGLSLTPDTLALTDGTARLSGGRVTGALRVAREGTRADVRGELGVEGAALGDLIWRDGQRPVARGRLDINAEFAASGHTLAGLVAEMRGEGVASVMDARIIGLNPAPFDPSTSLPVAPSTEAGDAPAQVEEDDTRAAFAAHLAAGDWTVASLAIPFSIEGGRLTVEEVALEEDGTTVRASALMDIEAWQLESNWTLTAPGEDDALAVGLVFRGPLGAPARWIDVAPLTAWINLRRLEQQIRAVEAENDALAAEADAIDAALTPRNDAPAADTPGTVTPAPDAGGEPPAPEPVTRVDPEQAPPQAADTDEPAPGDDAPPSEDVTPSDEVVPGEELGSGDDPPPGDAPTAGGELAPDDEAGSETVPAPTPRPRPDEAAAGPSRTQSAAAGDSAPEGTQGEDAIVTRASPSPSRAEQFRVHLEDVDRAVLALGRRQREQEAARDDLMRRLGLDPAGLQQPTTPPPQALAPSTEDGDGETVAPFRVLPEDLVKADR